MKLIDHISQTSAQMARLRRQIHANPELCFEEHNTANIVACCLDEWGITYHRGLGGTGIVGVVHGRDAGASGVAIGLRADMDALPMQETNQFAHASKNANKMHACGHDGHTAMLLSAAEYWSHAKRRNFDGTVYLIFQPAEETGAGAKSMIEEGMLEKFPMQAIFGMHNWPSLPVGSMASSAGPVMASSNEFSIQIKGRGGHAGMPHDVVDPMPVAAQIILALQTIVSRNVKPLESAVVSVTMVHGGDAFNVVPNGCELRGTVRTFATEVTDLVEKRLRALSENIAKAFSCSVQIDFLRSCPPTINSTQEAQLAREVMLSILPLESVPTQQPSLAAEDFSYMLLQRPGAYCFIGNGTGEHREVGHSHGPCELHNPSYDFNDALIPLGATYWVRLAEYWFMQKINI